jgi:predicted CopG family antitoxin
MCTYMTTYRQPEIEIAARIGISEPAYTKLRKMKRHQKRSMVAIVSELIMKQDVEMSGVRRAKLNT